MDVGSSREIWVTGPGLPNIEWAGCWPMVHGMTDPVDGRRCLVFAAPFRYLRLKDGTELTEAEVDEVIAAARHFGALITQRDL